MSSTAPAPTRRPVAALQHPTRVQVTKEDQRNILRAYVTCRSAEQRAEIYGEAVDPIYADGSQIDFSRAPIEASNVLGSVVGDIVSRRTLELMVSNRPLIDGVLTDFSSEAVAKNQTVYTRSVALPPVADFGAAASDTADTDYPVTLSNHKQVLYSFTASEYLSTSRNLVEERAQANAESLGDHLVDSVAALITDAFSSETTGAAAGKEFSDVLAAAAALNAAGAPTFRRTMWVNSEFSSALSLAALSFHETLLKHIEADFTQAYGHWRNFKGFEHIWEYPALPSNSINLIGFAFQSNALILAVRVATDPQKMIGAGYPGTLEVITNPKNGLSLLSDRWVTQGSRAVNTRLDLLYGCARGNVAAGHKFVTA